VCAWLLPPAGKTLVYALPLICISLQEELLMPLEGGEGPLGLIICPSRELANQTVEVITQYTEALHAVRLAAAAAWGVEGARAIGRCGSGRGSWTVLLPGSTPHKQ
jgi:superfamily II DNA/RNA helicase